MRNKTKKLALVLASVFTLTIGSAGFATAAKTKAEKTVLTIELFDRSNTPAGGGTVDNNWLTREIQKEFGDPNNITVKYVPVPRSQEREKLNILMASNAAPDISFTYDQTMFQSFATQGGLTDLTPYYKTAKNLQKFEGDNIDYGKIGGKLYAISMKRTYLAKHGSFIREDLLKKVGMKAPTNVTEFEAVLKAFKKADPSIIPFGLVNTSTYAYDLEFGADSLIRSFVKTNISDKDLQTLPNIKLPGYKDGVKFLNKLYNEGLIDPDFALDKNDSKLNANIVNGKIGFYTYNTDSPYVTGKDSSEATLEKNVPGAKLIPINVFKNSAGKYLHSRYASNGMYIFVPKTSKHAAEAVKYFDWMATDKAERLVEWGVYGITYTMKNGVPDTSNVNLNWTSKNYWKAGDIGILCNGTYAPNEAMAWKMMENDKLNYGKYAKLFVQSSKLALKDTYIDYQYLPKFDRPIQANIKYGSSLQSIYSTYMVKCIMAKPAEFDGLWNQFINEYMKNGGQEVQTEKISVYNDMHKK